MATYYAISGIGWGRGDTPADATDEHTGYCLQACPSWVDRKDWRDRVLGTPPTVFLCPEDADGFSFSGSKVYWTKGGKVLREATSDIC